MNRLALSGDHPARISLYLPDVNWRARASGFDGVESTTHTCEGRVTSFQPPPFARYPAEVITRTSDFAGPVALGARSSLFAMLEKAIHLPFGDHDGPPAPRGRSVTGRASPPSSEIT